MPSNSLHSFHYKSLVLSREYLPLYFIDSKQALILNLTGRAEALEYFPDMFVRSVSKCFQVPAIIKISLPYKQFYARKPSKISIYYRDNFTCAYCGRILRLNECTVDHIIPKSKGGDWSWENLVTCCLECNRKKADNIWTPKFVKPVKPTVFTLQRKQLNIHPVIQSWLDEYFRNST